MLGHEMLEAVGSDNVVCFCDNNTELSGTQKYGLPVVSFEELKEKYRNAVVIICADLRRGNAHSIAGQCEKGGISDYFFCWAVRNDEIFSCREKLLSVLRNPENRIAFKNALYMERVKDLRKQTSYLKRHLDIRHIKPAGGKLREKQIEIISAAAELLEKLGDLGISPFLYGGNLLGYVRHNGFIPWDDDIDFALMREEYEKLRGFCRTNMYTEEEFQARESCGRDVRKEFRNYYYGNGGGDEFNIYQVFSDGSKIVIDFFVLDYYADDYSFDELITWRESVRLTLNDAIPDKGKVGGAIYDDEKRIKCFQTALRENQENFAKESNHIYFGIDNMDMMLSIHRAQWIPEDVVFPLKKVLYEGAAFYVPNNAEEFVKFIYKDIWKMPDDIGIPQHVGSMLAGEENW